MSRGLKIPVGVDGSGGAALSEGEEENLKIIRLSLTSSDNENAFQQLIGLGEEIIFDIEDPASRAQVTMGVQKLFEDFEVQKRFKLLPETVAWKSDDNSGELQLSFRYQDLESDEEKPFEMMFGSST